jgi:hypothetical protein
LRRVLSGEDLGTADNDLIKRKAVFEKRIVYGHHRMNSEKDSLQILQAQAEHQAFRTIVPLNWFYQPQ